MSACRWMRALRAGLLTAALGADAAADDPSLAVDKIPLQLRVGASAVVRRHEMVFRAEPDGGGTLRVRSAVTVLEASARRHGELEVWYDSFTSVDDIEASILDAHGEEVASFGESDFEDYAGYDGLSLAQDVRVKVAQLAHGRLPYTIVFEYELERSSTFMWPEWVAHPTRDPVELARFEVRMPSAMPLRWWCNVDSVPPVAAEVDGDSVYEWKLTGLPALPPDDAWDSWEDATVHVRIAPPGFVLGGAAGSLASWSDFGAWFHPRYTERRDLSPEAVREVRELVADVTDPRERIRRVYRYLQNRTRYISIQLGLGGWVPMSASSVHQRGYGDCKALANYAVALLEAAGITAYPVIIRSGYMPRPMVPEFPSNQFNHVIVCAPLGRDSVWLECTSRSMSPGRIGGANEARLALMITPEGGRLVATPTSTADENRLTRTARMTLEPAGAVEGEVRMFLTGNQHDRFRTQWEDRSAVDRVEWILREAGMAEAAVTSVSVDSTEHSAASVAFRATVPGYGSKTGQRLFVPLNPFERTATEPRTVENRRSPVNLRYRYLDVDTVVWQLPENYRIESLPKGVSVSSEFGQFSTAIDVPAPGQVRLIRTVRITQPIIPAAQYDDVRAFFRALVRADRGQIVLIRAM